MENINSQLITQELLNNSKLTNIHLESIFCVAMTQFLTPIDQWILSANFDVPFTSQNNTTTGHSFWDAGYQVNSWYIYFDQSSIHH